MTYLLGALVLGFTIVVLTLELWIIVISAVHSITREYHHRQLSSRHHPIR